MTSLECRARIEAISDGLPRPMWSVIIPVFNCATYLEEALASVLAEGRAPADMEILVIDDHSTEDDPEEVVRRLAGGRASFIRQPENVGKIRNYETGLAASRGYFIHQLHGDDRIRPGFYDEMEDAFRRFPEAGAFFCEAHYIDATGELIGRTGRLQQQTGIVADFLAQIVVAQRIQTPSIVVRRTAYETLGGFDRRLDVFEDWEMWIRIATRFQIGFLAETLADYRVAPGSSTSTSMIRGTRVAALRRMLEIVDGFLPPEVLQRCRADRDRELAQYLIQFIPALMARREFTGVARIFREAFRFSSDPRTVYRMLRYAALYRRMTTV